MDRTIRLALIGLLALVAAAPAVAEQPKCPLEISACLSMYERMRERPWLGIEVERDSLGRQVVRGTLPDSPARKAGLKAGDVIERIDDLSPREWFATKAGWKDGDQGEIRVRRGGRERRVPLAYQAIPEATLAKIVGAHMLEGHLAYMHPKGQASE